MRKLISNVYDSIFEWGKTALIPKMSDIWNSIKIYILGLYKNTKFIDIIFLIIFLMIFGSYKNVQIFSTGNRLFLLALVVIYFSTTYLLYLSNKFAKRNVKYSKYFSWLASIVILIVSSIFIDIFSKPFLNPSTDLFLQGGTILLMLFVLMYFSPQYIVNILGRFIKYEHNYYKSYNRRIKILLTIMLLSFSLFEVDQAYKQFLVDVFNYSVDILENQSSFINFSRVVYLEGVLVFLMLSEIMDLDKMFNKNQENHADRHINK